MKTGLTDQLCECGCGLPTRYSWSGKINRYIHGHSAKGHGRPRSETVKRYRMGYDNGKLKLLHRIRAEKALGKPLPHGAIVHHADGSKSDTAPLVICPDDAYHMLLHRRMRVKAAGGDPNTDLICAKCQAVKHQTGFHAKRNTYRGFSLWCKVCYSAYHRGYLARKKAS